MTALEKFEWNFLWPMFLLLILTLKTFIFRSNLNFLKVKVTQLYLILCDPNVLYSPSNSPGQNTGAGSWSLLQGIFPTHGLNPGLPPCRQILCQLSHQESPRILEWVAYPFSSGCSQPRNQTGVSFIAGGFFTNWAIREALSFLLHTNFLNIIIFQITFLTPSSNLTFHLSLKKRTWKVEESNQLTNKNQM